MRRSRLVPVSELADRYKRAQRKLELRLIRIRTPGNRIVWGYRSMRPDPTNLAFWLLNFVQTDLTTLSPEDWRSLQDELVVFSLPPNQFSPGDRPSVGALERPPQRREIEGIQRELKRGITRLLKSQPWTIKDVQIRRILLWREGKIVRAYWGRTFRERFLVAAANLLEEVGESIKVCPECERLFPAVKRQAYCSPRCSQNVRTRKFRARHKETLQERRRARYEESLRAVHGGRVKIQRRRGL